MSTQRSVTSKALALAVLALFIGSALWLGLTGFSSLSPSIQIKDQAKSKVRITLGGMSEHMPDMADGHVCAMCRAAPGPAAQSVGEQTKAVMPKAWYAHLHLANEPLSRLGLSLAQATLPVRIAFCRWLN